MNVDQLGARSMSVHLWNSRKRTTTCPELSSSMPRRSTSLTRPLSISKPKTLTNVTLSGVIGLSRIVVVPSGLAARGSELAATMEIAEELVMIDLIVVSTMKFERSTVV